MVVKKEIILVVHQAEIILQKMNYRDKLKNGELMVDLLKNRYRI
jgi:hypothetical protein